MSGIHLLCFDLCTDSGQGGLLCNTRQLTSLSKAFDAAAEGQDLRVPGKPAEDLVYSSLSTLELQA